MQLLYLVPESVALNLRISRNIRKTLAYILLPVSFSVLTYGCILFMGKDVISTAMALSKLVIATNPSNARDISELSTFDRAEAEKRKPSTTLVAETEEESKEKNDEEVAVGQESESDVTVADTSSVPVLDYIPYESISYPINGTLMGCVICERIGLDVDLYKSATDETLEKGVATENGSRMPGFGGTVVICGHRQLDFSALQYAQVGDEFTIMTSYENYVYRVRDIQIISAEDTELLGFDKDYENLVFFTCYPFADTVGKKTERYVLYCDYVSGRPVRE